MIPLIHAIVVYQIVIVQEVSVFGITLFNFCIDVTIWSIHVTLQVWKGVSEKGL